VAGQPSRDPSARWRTATLLGVGAALLLAAGLVTAQLIDDATADSPAGRDDLCSQLDTLLTAADDDGVFATQALNRAARRLSDLAEAYAQPTFPAGDPPVAQAAQDIREVTTSVAWEVADLVRASRPVALECGWRWPLTATPPAPPPVPPDGSTLQAAS
jgi:hypothetical protein